ncbi:MAG: pyridoxamine 5'-phosphate oxidase [Bacteroidota bacterium]
MGRDISQIRREYAGKYLNEETAGKDPITLFNQWFDEAIAAEVLDANAFTLSTISADGRPDGRILLIKGVEDGKFVFYTNYKSKKGKDLEANPIGAMTFYHKELDRQIRIEGIVEKYEGKPADEYFSTRPIKSRIGAWISKQSSPIPSRIHLMRKFTEYSLSHIGQPVGRPPFWGGFALSPDHMEFWQGRPSRLHDRINFRLIDGAWTVERLSP